MTYLNPTARTERFPQKATYWSQKKQDGLGGETWEPPVLLDCRWEDYAEEKLSVAYRAEGEIQESGAHVFTKVPTVEGGWLYLGETTEANPSRLRVGNNRAFVIRKVSGTPALRGQYAEYIAFL